MFIVVQLSGWNRCEQPNCGRIFSIFELRSELHRVITKVRSWTAGHSSSATFHRASVGSRVCVQTLLSHRWKSLFSVSWSNLRNRTERVDLCATIFQCSCQTVSRFLCSIASWCTLSVCELTHAHGAEGLNVSVLASIPCKVEDRKSVV